MKVAKKIVISGLVQGIGFRPFVWRIAQKYQITGWVKNSLAGVEIFAEGEAKQIEGFIAALKKEKPSLAKIERLRINEEKLICFKDFSIVESERKEEGVLIVPADLPVCDDCLRELTDKKDRRFRYPFINCTNCGPRYTIIQKLPYDRKNTSMKGFPLCQDCSLEYQKPDNRRFHAEPVACPACGPKLFLYDNEKNLIAKEDEAITITAKKLKEGKIVAIKGLGGYHLAVDPFNVEAVLLLRQRKQREAKPFALMARDLLIAKQHVHLNKTTIDLLNSKIRPIVLCPKKKSSNIVRDVSPDNEYLGIMLPYTPVHYLLMEQFEALIMTSANLSEEPIVYHDDDAFLKLNKIADFILTNNRPILRPVDDSVAFVNHKKPLFIRRARGIAPLPLHIPKMQEGILALGGQLKNSFAITKKDYVYLSQYFGNLDNIPSRSAYLKGVEDFCSFFEFTPKVIAYDLHPGYYTTELAEEKFSAKIKYPVQHHKAHLAAVVAEKKVKPPFLGVVFDGTGYGEDGKIWGGEFFISLNESNYERFVHLKYFPLLDGDDSIKKPWKTALSLLLETNMDHEEFTLKWNIDKNELNLVTNRFSQNKVGSSSIGRLFDGVSALLGLKTIISYEGQAAIVLETKADYGENSFYDFTILNEKLPYEIDYKPIILGVINDLKKGVRNDVIAGKFHNTIVEMIVKVAKIAEHIYGIKKVVFSGGVFQNRILLQKSFKKLRVAGYKPIFPEYVPVNDQGLALGQAYLANKFFLRSDI